MNKQSTRAQILQMTPGDSQTFDTQSVRVSYLRCLASVLHQDHQMRFAVHLAANNKVTITRIA